MVTIVVMCLAAAGLVLGLVKHKAGQDWGRPLAVCCAVVVLVCALAILMHRRAGGLPAHIESLYEEIAVYTLGKHVRDTIPGAKAIVLVRPRPDFQTRHGDPLTDGLRMGLAGKVMVVAEVHPELPAQDRYAFLGNMPPTEAEPGRQRQQEDMFIPYEFWYSAELFDSIVEKYQDQCDVLITTMGLPRDWPQMGYWDMQKRPAIALFGGSVHGLSKHIAAGSIIAAVAEKPDPAKDLAILSEDLEQMFAKRYLLVTPANVTTMAGAHPQLFTRK